MNYMKKQELTKIRQLAKGIGQFIRYWGFRNIHGEIWALVYLSKEPLSGIELSQILKVSKALVSPALKELEAEGLIQQSASENAKTKRYVAQEDVASIIQGVLKRREFQMLAKVNKSYEHLRTQARVGDGLDTDRLQSLGLMIQMAQLGLASLIDSKNFGAE
jgi:DNA-binding transcriptional regulator GbsR (MarR family)